MSPQLAVLSGVHLAFAIVVLITYLIDRKGESFTLRDFVDATMLTYYILISISLIVIVALFIFN